MNYITTHLLAFVVCIAALGLYNPRCMSLRLLWAVALNVRLSLRVYSAPGGKLLSFV